MEDFDKFASEVIVVALGRLPKPPVDLFQVAASLGVADIARTRFRDGFTDFGSTGPVIYLNKLEQIPRMRSVLAHELAHVMLRKQTAMNLIEQVGRSCLLPGEERLANKIAATLLMPDSLVEVARRGYLTLETLERIADCAIVTPLMVATRLANAGIDIALLHWRRGNRFWHVIDRPGVPASLHGEVTISKIGAIALESLGQHESAIIVDCCMGGRNVKLHGTGWRKGEHVIQLIAPSRDIRFPSRSTQQRLAADSWRPIIVRACSIW